MVFSECKILTIISVMEVGMYGHLKQSLGWLGSKTTILVGALPEDFVYTRQYNLEWQGTSIQD